MEPLNILYIILAVSVVVVSATFVYLSGEIVKLTKSLRRSADDAAVMTKELKEKVLMVSEAMDRIGTLTSHFIGLIEEAQEKLSEKRDKIAEGLGLVVGVSDYVKKRRAEKTAAPAEPEPEKSEPDEPEPEPEKPKPEKEEKSEKPEPEQESKEKVEKKKD